MISEATLRRSVAWAAPFAIGIGLIDLLFGRIFLGSVDLLTAAGLLAIWWLCRRKGDRAGFHHLLVFLGAFIFLGALLDGGLAGAGFIWSIGFPTAACFIVGSRAGLAWSLAYMFAGGLVLWMSRDAEWAMHYEFAALAYGLVAYTMFAGFAYFLAAFRERREKELLLAKAELARQSELAAESERNYRTLLETLPIAVGVHADGQWIYANQASLRLFGAETAEALIGRPVMDVVHPSSRPMVAERMAQMQQQGKPVPTVEEKLVRCNGEVFYAEVQASPIIFQGRRAVLTACRDTTELRRRHEELESLRAQLEHAQRLESLGTMAGGIAHDFNNIVAAIMGNAELAGLEVEPDSPAALYMAHIDEACERAAGLCRQMLAYAGKGEFSIVPTNIVRLIDRLAGMLRASIGKRTSLVLALDENLPEVLVDTAQFQQVLLNFIVNAAEAIGENPGEINVIGRKVTRKSQELVHYFNGSRLAAGEYVSLMVRDNGPGMDAETLSRIFDPFFTTKESGHGLGLSAVLGIMQRLSGAVRVRSEPGRGSEFEILLPIARGEPERAVSTHETMGLMGSGKVLVVDDEPGLRSLVGEMLGKLGFEPVEAENGREGVERFRMLHSQLRLVLLDMTMPEMGGVDALHEMRRIDAGVPIVFVSGYHETELSTLPDEDQADAFLQKPFRFSALKKLLARLVIQGSSGN